jgi:hypothetical protein
LLWNFDEKRRKVQETGEIWQEITQKDLIGGKKTGFDVAERDDAVSFFWRWLAEILNSNYENAYFQARSLYLADQALWACLINKFS